MLPRHLPRKIAVIGAGAAGLVTLRELLAHGLDATCFERSRGIGGTWEIGGSGSAMYASLRTNLPKQVMQFRDEPFEHDVLQFPGHADVLRYLHGYATRHDLGSRITLGTRCTACDIDESGDGGGVWKLALKDDSDSGDGHDSVRVDAVVVCSGHFSRPYMPHLRGMAAFEGENGGRRCVLHSFDYRDAAPFAGLRVVVVGAGASGVDISRELAGVCTEVHMATRSGGAVGDSVGGTADKVVDGVRVHGEVEELLADGTVRFSPPLGAAASAKDVVRGVDAVIACTGYRYDFPFLDNPSSVLHTPRDTAAVGPLYRHVFIAPTAAPLPGTLPGSMSFIGLPFKVAPFRCFELQARWVARVLAGEVQLPPPATMAQEAAAARKKAVAHGVPDRHFHTLGAQQWSYFDAIADAIGMARHEAMPQYVRELYEQTSQARTTNPASYRDSTEFCT